jgi:hypothetical protein
MGSIHWTIFLSNATAQFSLQRYSDGQRKGPFYVPEENLMALTRLITEKPRSTIEVRNYHSLETLTDGDPC